MTAEEYRAYRIAYDRQRDAYAREADSRHGPVTPGDVEDRRVPERDR